MKFLTDFFPLIIFFTAYQTSKDLIVATGALIAATLAQVAFMWLRHRKVEKMHLITLVFVVILGGATVAFQDDTFIMWKPTVVNWILAVVFIGSEFIGGKNIIQRMLENNIDLPGPVWRNLNFGWAGFFILSGVLNLYVAFNFSQEFWVNFKVFGLLGLTIVFVVIQGVYMSRYLKDETS